MPMTPQLEDAHDLGHGSMSLLKSALNPNFSYYLESFIPTFHLIWFIFRLFFYFDDIFSLLSILYIGLGLLINICLIFYLKFSSSKECVLCIHCHHCNM